MNDTRWAHSQRNTNTHKKEEEANALKTNEKTSGGQINFLHKRCKDGAMINVCACYGHTECVIYRILNARDECDFDYDFTFTVEMGKANTHKILMV